MMASFLSPCRFTSLSHFSTPPIRVSNLSNPHRVTPPTPTPAPAPARARTTSNSMSQLNAGLTAESQGENVKLENSDVLMQYVVLRRDLIDSWPLGSVITQGCHASVSAIWSYKDDPHTALYCGPENIDSMHKVTLEVKGETQILNLSNKLTAGGISHKLWIEQPENIPTCLATKPYPKSTGSSYFKSLKLCK